MEPESPPSLIPPEADLQHPSAERGTAIISLIRDERIYAVVNMRLTMFTARRNTASEKNTGAAKLIESNRSGQLRAPSEPRILQRTLAMHQRPFGMLGERGFAEFAQDFALVAGSARFVQFRARIGEDVEHVAVLFA